MTVSEDLWTSFELTLSLGNETMGTAADIASTLRDVADRLEHGTVAGNLRDANGNHVGTFAILVEP